MTVFKDWLLGVTAAAMLLALEESLTPKGAVRQIGKLTGGLVLMLAILQPVLKLDYPALAGALSRYREDLGTYQVQPKTDNFRLMKSIIEAKSAAYIQDKAAGLGILCRVMVTCGAQTEEEYPYPTAVLVEGALTDAEVQHNAKYNSADGIRH